jgi:two-component system, OmpR family, response regulator ResD
MRRILVADDEKVVRDVMLRFLKLQGFDVSTAEDGRETVRKALEEDFDLLIMDLRMPGLKATEILVAIKKSKKNLPVVILTGTIDAEESEALRKLGYTGEDILCKPADLFEILKKVKEKLPD